jgi:peroxiredoxin
MASTHTPICDFGAPAPDFSLPGIDGKTWSLQDCRGPRGLLVMFICNHCPYVKAINRKLVRDTAELITLGVHSVAIMANDTQSYPEDSFENMQRVAREMRYPFPYLLDETQAVARAYGAVCTPDFFGYNARLELQYRGRLDESGRQPGAENAARELFLAMKAVAGTGRGPERQVPSIGCSIKWRGSPD